jgi:flagellar biogenesis protein FliO
MYVDAGAGSILLQMVFWIAVVVVGVWLFRRIARRR